MEGRAKAPQGRGRGKLGDFVFGLLGDEFALEVCASVVSVASDVWMALCRLQCSCFPVKMEPSGGTDMVENLDKAVSLRIGLGGRSCWASPRL
jgi:hypothetical protein